MKHLFALFGLLGLLPLSGPAQSEAGVPRLTGLIKLDDRRCAVLEIPPSSANDRSTPTTAILGVGEREAQLGVEVLRINAELGTAELKLAGTNLLLSMSGMTNASASPYALETDQLPLRMLLKLYAEFCNRTVLPHPTLPAVSFSIHAAPPDAAGAARVLEKALAGQEIVTIPEGDKFVLVVPKSFAGNISLHTNTPAPTWDVAVSTNLLPVGALNFTGATAGQVAAIYAALIGRQLDRDSRPPPGAAFILRNQTALTPQEAVSALRTFLAWQGLKMIPVGDQQARLVLIQSE
jgi:hypothetical protein